MKTKTGRLYRMSVTMLSLVFLTGVCSLATAGHGRNTGEKSKSASGNGSTVTPPPPVTDDSPIDPATHSKGKSDDTSRNHQSTNGHDKGKQRRGE